jgi:hypothetical protein
MRSSKASLGVSTITILCDKGRSYNRNAFSGGNSHESVPIFRKKKSHEMMNPEQKRRRK